MRHTTRCRRPRDDRLQYSGYPPTEPFPIRYALQTETSSRRLQKSISKGKNSYYGRVHCNDEPKQNTSLSTQPLYFISDPSEFLGISLSFSCLCCQINVH